MKLAKKVKGYTTTKLTTAILKLIARKALPFMVLDFEEYESDRAVMDIHKQTIFYACTKSQTIKYKMVLNDNEFNQIENFSMGGFTIDPETAKEVLSKIEVSYNKIHLHITGYSSLAPDGKIKFSYEVAKFEQQIAEEKTKRLNQLTDGNQ